MATKKDDAPGYMKPMKKGKGLKTRPSEQALNSPKTNHGKMSFFAKGGKAKGKGC